MDDYILELPNYVPLELCNQIVNKFKNDQRKEYIPILYKVGGKELEVNSYAETVDMFQSNTYDGLYKKINDVCKRVYERYIEHLDIRFKELNKKCLTHPYTREIYSNKNIHISGFILHEIKKGNMYSWHHDDHNCNISKNFIQMIIYLNTLEDEEGGCTEFVCGKKIRPEIGKVLVYPKSWTYPHMGGEVVGDTTKYICTASFNIEYRE